jgi:hypothetical protein
MKKMFKVMPKPNVSAAVDRCNLLGTSSDAVILYSELMQEQVLRS